MDSDLSLLEIADEDDSLLLPIQNEGVGEGHGSSSIFLCSPLQIPSSELSDNPLLPPKVPQTECRARFPGSRKPSSSSPKDGVNKDIINVNNSEAPKLSLEPQKMKRKKKGGGYNLRKSLAWDRAFFTEEGVLNPLELSMISGDYNKHIGGMLCAIHEEEQNPVSSNMDITSDPSEFQALEEKLFKQSSASNSLADGKLGACLLPKHDASTNDSVDPPSSAKRKVLAVHDVNRSGSKRTGCPRTVASSSPATTKASIKQPKVSKIPVPKANTHVISTPVRSTTLGASYSKKDQNACPVSNFEKSVGLKGVPKRAKNPLADKSITTGISVRQARRNVTNSRSEIKSAATPHHLLVMKVKAGIEVIPDPLLSSTGHPSGNMVESRKVAVFPTQNACSSGGNMQKTQFQSAKPSGLRMPSPSMGYFNQPKASTSNMLLQKGSQLCNPSKSSTPNIRKVGVTNSIHEVRPANAPAKVSRVANDVAKSGTSKSSISDAKLKASLKVNTNSNQKAEVNVQSNTTDCEKVINQHQSDVTSDYTNRKPLEHAEEHKCASTEHNMMGQYTVGQTNGTLYEDNGSSTEFHQFTNTNQKAEVNDQSDSTGCEKVSNQQQSGAILDDTNRKSLEHAEEHRSAITVENMMGQFKVVQTNGTLYEDSGSSAEVHQFNCVEIADPTGGDCSKIELDSSVGESHTKHREQPKHHTVIPNGGYAAELQSVKGNLSVENRRNTLHTLLEVNQLLSFPHDTDGKCGAEPELPNPSTVGEKNSSNDYESQLNAIASESKTSSVLCPRYSPIQDWVSDMSDMDECLHLEDIQSDAVDRDVVFEICNQFVESQLKHDFELRNPATSLALERLGEDSINVPETASSTEVNNVCPTSGDDDGDKSEYLPLTPTLCAVLQENGGLEINEFINSENVKDDRSKLPVNNCCTISDIQSRNKSDSRGDTSTLNCGLLVGKNNSRKSFEEQAKLAISLSYEAAKVPCEENNSPLEYHEQLHEKNELFEVPPEVNLRVKVADESEPGNPCGLPEHKLVGQEIRETVTKNLSEESFVVDALVRSTYENSLVDNCNIMPITSVTNNQYPVAVDSIDEYYDLPELQKPYLVELQLDHDARGLHLNGDFLLAKKTCSKEVMEEIVLEGSILEQNILDSQTITELDDGSLNVDEKAETLQMGDAQRGSIEVFPLDANLKCCIDTRFGHKNMLIHEPNSKIESSAKLGDHQIPEAVNSKSVKLSDLSQKSVGPVTNDLTLCGKILQGSEVTVSKSRTLAEEAESNVFCNNECPDTEMQHDLEKTMSGTGDSNKTIQLGSNKSGNKSKQDALVIKPPPDAAPFSDEWLAAFEAAGEDILTIKSGAVQNSPPDKPPHELGPWSPVKRKTNQAIGPFDCTKYTSIPPSGSQ